MGFHLVPVGLLMILSQGRIKGCWGLRLHAYLRAGSPVGSRAMPR